MFVVLADTWQIYVAKYHTKNAPKMLLKRTSTQTKFYITSWLGLQNVLMELNHVYEKLYPQHGSLFISFIWQNQIFLWREFIKWRILTWVLKVVILPVYFSRSTHITRFGAHTRKLVANYRQMNYLESKLVCWNVVNLPIGKQRDIAKKISEKVG